MRATFIILLTLFSLNIYSHDTLYFDKSDLLSIRAKAYYYQLDKYILKNNRYLSIKYWMNGSIYLKVEYKDSLLKINDGIYLNWFPNGQISDSGQYVNDQRNGIWSFYFENGQKSASVKFVDDKIALEEYWDSNGNKHLDTKTVHRIPSFPGGPDKLRKYLSKSIKYPSNAKNRNIHGKVIVRFIIAKTGEIQEVYIVKGVENSLNNEVIRAIKNMPIWEPAIQFNRQVLVRMILPINFK